MARSLVLSNFQGILGCFSSFPKSYPAKGWLSIFTGTKEQVQVQDLELRPVFTDLENRDPNQAPNSLESRLKSSFLLPNSKLKNPFVKPL
ncbi:hypothetical protein AVEN_99147-1 [Araneus ventricosus]|uniref:Uncharacterized protein n=1 Tax=Araneus ventricosus TaxID=182803 RepID=A0A4Y2X4I0_ARAVE|nr:hypothetical protein AVEN_99147-1 [Araneus ventricosus]